MVLGQLYYQGGRGVEINHGCKYHSGGGGGGRVQAQVVLGQLYYHGGSGRGNQPRCEYDSHLGVGGGTGGAGAAVLPGGVRAWKSTMM